MISNISNFVKVTNQTRVISMIIFITNDFHTTIGSQIMKLIARNELLAHFRVFDAECDVDDERASVQRHREDAESQRHFGVLPADTETPSTIRARRQTGKHETNEAQRRT